MSIVQFSEAKMKINMFGEANGTTKSQRFLLVRLLDTLHFGETTE